MMDDDGVKKRKHVTLLINAAVTDKSDGVFTWDTRG